LSPTHLHFISMTMVNHQTNNQTNRWNAGEDAQLRAAVLQFGCSDWKRVADVVPGRDNSQCLQRWSRSLKPGIKKGKWSADEDKTLKAFVGADSANISWSSLSEQIIGRTSKQCRERWFQHLAPHLNRTPFTEEEDALLLKLHAQLGNVWTTIAAHVNGRTADAVKVRLRSLSRSSKSMQEQQQANEGIRSPQKKRERVPRSTYLGMEQWLQDGGPRKQQKAVTVETLLGELVGTKESDDAFLSDIEMLLAEAEAHETNERVGVFCMQERVKGWAYFVMGTASFFEHKNDFSHTNFKKALHIATSDDLEVRDRYLEGWCYFKLSVLAFRTRHYDISLSYGVQCQEVAVRLGHQGLRKWAHVAVGYAYTGVRRFDEALREGNKGRELNGADVYSLDLNAELWLHNLLASAYLGRREFTLALAYAESGLDFDKKHRASKSRVRHSDTESSVRHSDTESSVRHSDICYLRAVGWTYFSIAQAHSFLAKAADADEFIKSLHIARAQEAQAKSLEAAKSSNEIFLAHIVGTLGASVRRDHSGRVTASVRNGDNVMLVCHIDENTNPAKTVQHQHQEQEQQQLAHARVSSMNTSLKFAHTVAKEQDSIGDEIDQILEGLYEDAENPPVENDLALGDYVGGTEVLIGLDTTGDGILDSKVTVAEAIEIQAMALKQEENPVSPSDKVRCLTSCLERMSMKLNMQASHLDSAQQKQAASV